jgi:anaerobic selenocysteine-containing dehydrogenase
VTIEDNQVVEVRGSKANPITHGAVCAKVAKYYPEFVHGPNRFRQPLKRVGPKGRGRFEQISWDTALDIIHDRVDSVIKRYGRRAVLPLNFAPSTKSLPIPITPFTLRPVRSSSLQVMCGRSIPTPVSSMGLLLDRK